jgi:hypothetical protein
VLSFIILKESQKILKSSLQNVLIRTHISIFLPTECNCEHSPELQNTTQTGDQELTELATAYRKMSRTKRIEQATQ